MTFELDPDILKRNAVMRSMSDIPAEKIRKLVLGGIFTRIFPGRTVKLEENRVKISLGAFDRLLRTGPLARALWHGDPVNALYSLIIGRRKLLTKRMYGRIAKGRQTYAGF
ncbi:MAG: hypothetical protein AAF564_15755 [Bacteroidota bacterium]